MNGPILALLGAFMRIFMSYASEQKTAAEAIAFSLRNRGNQVFLDRDDLPEGTSYDAKIEKAVSASDLLIFLISPESVAEGKYTLTELRFARQKWRDPSQRVLPVMLVRTPMDKVPPYLKAVSILEPQGNATAEVASAAEKLRGVERAVNVAAILALMGAATAFVAGLMPAGADSWLPQIGPYPLENGIILGAFFSAAYWCLATKTWWKIALIVFGGIIGWNACELAFGYFFSGSFERIFRTSGTSLEKPMNNIIGAISSDKLAGLTDDIKALKDYIQISKDASEFWLMDLAFVFAGLAGFSCIICIFTVVDRIFRSVYRWLVGFFVTLVASATGMLLANYIIGNKYMFGGGEGIFAKVKVYAFITKTDLYFALLYLPWFVAVAALIGYWLVRGQET
jgi:hypothetical protein